MKLRLALCAAVLFPGIAAFAQPQPWRFGPYDKLQPYAIRQPFLSSKTAPPQLGGAVVFVPGDVKAPVLLPTNHTDAGSRANYFRLAPPKSQGK
jgi:hypothetical protein